MIDFTNYKYGTKFEMSLLNDKEVKVIAKLNDIEYSPDRKPFLANLLIEESNNSLIPENSIMVVEVRLPEDTNYRFILQTPEPKNPTKFTTIEAKIHMN